MKFFLPDWEDRVDPNFEFVNDEFSPGHVNNSYKNDVYAHQIYSKKPVYDGILFSLSNFESKLKLGTNGNGMRTIRGISSVKEYLKIPKYSRIKIMGDCGAFSYVTEYEPPPEYSPEKTASLYSSLKFDFGVSPDHMAIKFLQVKENGKRTYKELPESERERRRQITLRNSEEFISIVKEKKLKFRPIGAAQGYSPETYADSVEKLISQGYDYVALGSLVQYNNGELLKILRSVQPLLEDRDLHLFGVLRPSYINEFEKLGVTSFDSASFFRKAWLRSGQNYLSSDGKWYSAIRIPFSSNRNLLKATSELGISQSSLETLEKRAYESLISYSRGEIDVDEALANVMEYDKLLTRSSKGEENLEHRYRRTLESRPWEKCGCEICQKNGIEVIIFRGANRNKRRGFHNTWVFKNQLMPARLQAELKPDALSALE
jgi:hypothetical protein